MAAFARAETRNALKDASTTPSLTTGTSLTDAASEATEGSTKSETQTRNPGRARPAAGSYNLKALSGAPKRSPRKKGVEAADRAVSGLTLVDERSDSKEQLLQKSVQALDEDWNIGAMPGDGLKLDPTGEDERKRRRSTRLDILDRAASMVETTKSVLGKRGREVVEAGMETIKAVTGNKKATFPVKEALTPSFEGPSRKRVRVSQIAVEEEKSLQSAKQKFPKKQTKRWQSQGLYFGQERGFDARLTEAQDKQKKSEGKLTEPRENPIMPLPMFAGERTLEIGRNFRLPFNVFSPLLPGQPKPDEWKKTHKNVFVGNAAAIWKKAKPLEHSTCICKPDEGCNEHCFNRFMLYECDDSNCNVGAEDCTNRSFAGLKERYKRGGKYSVGVEVMKTVDRGYGVRANRTFEPNQIIVEYTGEIITQDECDDRMNKRYKNAECYYLMDFDQSMILDATRGSIARFINHSCAPNCRMMKWTVHGKPRMALFAGDEGIMTGEELTYDYNFNPYSLKNVQECRCGADGCRGVLGPKPKEIREALKPIVGGGKRKIQQVVEDAIEGVTNAMTKKRKLNVPTSVKTPLCGEAAKPGRTPSKLKKPKKEIEDITKKPGWKGWVLASDAPPLVVAQEPPDPEKLLRGLKRKSASNLPDEKEHKSRRKTFDGALRRASGTTLTDFNNDASRYRFSEKVEEDSENRASNQAEEKEVEDQQEEAGVEEFGGRRNNMKASLESVRKNVVSTVKKRGGSKRFGKGKGKGKSIRVIEDE